MKETKQEKNFRLRQTIVTAIIAVLVLAFFIYAGIQLGLNDKAKQIIAANNDLLAQSAKPASDKISGLKNLKIAALSADEMTYQQTITESLTTAFDSISNSADQSLSKVQQGINSPSINHSKKTSNDINTIKVDMEIAKEMASAATCLSQKYGDFKTEDDKIGSETDEFTTSTNYRNGERILKELNDGYGSESQTVQDAYDCFGNSLKSSSLFSIFKDNTDKDLDQIKNYREKYLNPLIDLYDKEDVDGIQKFVDDNTSTYGTISLNFPLMFEAQPTDNVDSIVKEYSDEVDNLQKSVDAILATTEEK